MTTIRQIRDNFSENNKLAEYSHDVTSQFGEDGIIRRIFEILPESDRWCVEFGAWDGKQYSNTYDLIANRGWDGVLIEADESKFEELLRTYAGHPRAQCINEFVQIDGGNSLDNLLADTDIPEDFDLLSIDIDGCDYHIWNSVSRYRPKLVIIEYNPSIPNDVVFIQDPNFELNHGNSLRAMIELGEAKGYQLIATTSSNGFFVRQEYFELFEIDDNSIGKMRDEQGAAMKIFQLYDGTLLTVGMTKLLWRDVEIGIDELQILPRSLRRYDDKAEQ